MRLSYQRLQSGLFKLRWEILYLMKNHTLQNLSRSNSPSLSIGSTLLRSSPQCPRTLVTLRYPVKKCAKLGNRLRLASNTSQIRMDTSYFESGSDPKVNAYTKNWTLKAITIQSGRCLPQILSFTSSTNMSIFMSQFKRWRKKRNDIGKLIMRHVKSVGSLVPPRTFLEQSLLKGKI